MIVSEPTEVVPSAHISPAATVKSVPAAGLAVMVIESVAVSPAVTTEKV